MDKLKLVTLATFMIAIGGALTAGAYAVGTATETHINLIVERSPAVQVEAEAEEAAAQANKPAKPSKKSDHPVPGRKPPVPPTPTGIQVN